MSINYATCQFCSKPDDSIQVICESRCLICSRCQLVPVIRKLLIDHTEFTSANGSNTAPTSDDHSNSNNQNNSRVLASHGNSSSSAVRGTCPICSGSISSNMLFLIQGFFDSLKNDDDEMMGKANSELLLEENTPLITTFLKRFKATYNDKDHVQVNLKAFVPSSDKEKSKKKKKSEDEGESDAAKLMRLASGFSLQDVHSGPVKLGIPSVLEFLLDCYCGMWQSMIRCGNESMLTMMLRQVCKKKYSQKTNDFRTKSLLDSLMSPAGTEIPELMVFCNLVGILPKVSGKISAAWGHIATSLLAAIHCDRCLKTNTLIDPFGNPNVSEFRSKLAKSILFQGYNVSATVANSNKMIPLKKAFRIIHLLATNYQPSWIMAPITSACVEYQSRLPWSAQSVAKLFNILFYVALFEQTISGRLSVMQAENSMHSGSMEHSTSDPMAAGKVMGKMYEKAMQSNSKDLSGKMRLSQSLSQLPSVSNKVPFQQSTGGGRRNTSLQMSVTETSATGASSTMNHRRTNIGLDQINIQRSMKNAGRLEMLKTIDTVIAKVWNTTMHPYLYMDTEKPATSQMAMIRDILIYLGDLDIAGTMQRTNNGGNMDAISEESSFASSSRRPPSHHHHHGHGSSRHSSDHHSHHHHGHHHGHHHSQDEHDVNEHPWSHLSPQEQPLHHIRMDVEQAMVLSETLTISMHDFILVTVRAWNCEYESIKADLQHVQLLKQRRQAITGHYDARQAKMTAQERLTITRLLQYYKRGEEIIGIDWDEVDDQADRHFFPFSLPKSLLSKSRNELQVLTDQVMQSLQAQSMQDNAYYGKRSTATLKQQTAYGTVASLIPHDHGVTTGSGNESEAEDVDMTMMKGISGGTAIQDNLPDDEVHLLVGQVSPRDTDDVVTTTEAPSITSSVQLYMLASELERGMGYTNSVFPAFRKQELELEQSIRAGIAEDFDQFNHRHPNYHEDGSWQDDGGSDSEDYDPEHAKNQWQKTKATTTAGFHADKHEALTKMHREHRSHGVLPGVNNGSYMSSLEGSTSLTDVDDLLPPLDAPTLDPTLSASINHHPGHGHSHHPPQASYHQSQSNLKRQSSSLPPHDSVSLPDVQQPNLTTIPKRLQSPANGGQRPPSGSLVRYNMDKKNQKKKEKDTAPAATTAGHGGATRVSESGDIHMKRKPGETGVGSAPGKHINIVDMIDVDGEVLERSGLTPGLSTNLRPAAHGKHHDGHVEIFEDTSLTTHPLEETISTFAPSNRARSGSKLNRKPVHNVNVDIIEDKETKKFTTKIVVEESFENSAFRPTRGGGDADGDADGDDDDGDDGGVHLPPVLNLEERRKFTRARLLNVVDNIAQDYHTTLEHQKKARMSHVRTKVMQRSDNKDIAANKSATMSSRPETTSRLAISVVAEKPFGSAATATTTDNDINTNHGNDATIGDGPQGSADSLTAPGGTRPHTSASTSSSTFAESQFLSRPFLDLSKGVRANGKFVVDLTDSLVAESAVTKLVLRDTKIVLPSFKLVMRTYCNPWQLESIRFMDLSGNPHCGGLMAAKVLGHSLSTYCQLVELNINHMKIGDSGLACLLQGMLQGHGQRFLQSLSLQHNDITMATSAIALLGHFSEIKSLDLSHNMFTLDTHAQTKYFTEAIEGLSSLEVLSLAYNKIQDAGFALALDLLLGQVPLRVLDVAECFITNFSTDHVRMILESTPKQRDKRYTTTMSMTFQLDAEANPGKPPLFRGLSRYLSTGRLGRSSMDLSGMEVPSNTRETSSAYQPTIVPIHLDHLFLQGCLIPQNAWVQLREAMLASTCKIYLHEEYGLGIAQFPVIDMSKYNL